MRARDEACVGVDLSGTNVRAAVVDAAGHVLGQERQGGRGGPEGTAGEFLQLGRGQRPGRFAPWARGEVMQDRVRADLNDAAAAGQPAQEQGVALFLGAGLDRADDLGPARGEMDPPGVGPARQGFGDRVGTAGSGLQPEKPVGPAQPGAVGYAEDSQPGRPRHPAVTPGGGLVRDPRHVGQGAERRSRLNRQNVDNLSVDRVEQRDFHLNKRNRSRDPAQFGLTVDYRRSDRAA